MGSTRPASPRTVLRAPCWFLCAALASLSACEDADPPVASGSGSADGDSDDETGSSSNLWLEFSEGCSTSPWRVVEDGDDIWVVLGGQGLLMIPMPLRAGGFDLPDELELNSPEIPMLNFQMRVDGHNYGVNDTFARIPNYPVLFSPLEGGDLYEFFYLTVFVPDEVGGEPQILDGSPAEIDWQLEVPGHGSIEGNFNATIRVDPPPLAADFDCGFG